jgi:hypothetical protein
MPGKGGDEFADMSQTLAVLSSEAVTIRLPSGLKLAL